MHRLLAAVLLLSAVPARAADERVDVAAGYSLVAADGESLHGWQAALAWPLSSRLALVADLSGHSADVEGETRSDLMALAGPRLTLLHAGRLQPFVHLLAGVVRSRASISVFDVEIAETQTDVGGVAGGGVNVRVTDRWAVRAQADYRLIAADGETVGDPRFGLGVVIRLGH